MTEINDQFSNIPDKGTRWRLRNRAAGKCHCGRKLFTKTKCRKHAKALRNYAKKRYDKEHAGKLDGRTLRSKYNLVPTI